MVLLMKRPYNSTAWLTRREAYLRATGRVPEDRDPRFEELERLIIEEDRHDAKWRRKSDARRGYLRGALELPG
jgi:hypothetical protein